MPCSIPQLLCTQQAPNLSIAMIGTRQTVHKIWSVMCEHSRLLSQQTHQHCSNSRTAKTRIRTRARKPSPHRAGALRQFARALVQRGGADRELNAVEARARQPTGDEICRRGSPCERRAARLVGAGREEVRRAHHRMAAGLGLGACPARLRGVRVRQLVHRRQVQVEGQGWRLVIERVPL